MIETSLKLLNKKHLLIVGGSETERRHYISKLIANVDYAVFRFPSKMKSLYEYVDFIKKEKLYKPWYKAKKYNINQIMDFHWDWIDDSRAFVVMEEFEQMEVQWRIELIRIYIDQIENRKKGEKKIHLIISQPIENGLIEQLSHVMPVRDRERRTKKQIVQQNLAVIDMQDWSKES